MLLRPVVAAFVEGKRPHHDSGMVRVANDTSHIVLHIVYNEAPSLG